MESIKYDPEQGLYCNDAGLVYERVSDFLSRFTPEFHAHAISKNVAKSRGISQDEVQAEWKEAIDKGNDLHLAIEHVLKGLNTTDSVYEEAAKWVRDYLLALNYHHFNSEEPVYDHNLMLAGTPDITGYRSRSAKAIVDILDAKGNLAKFTIRGSGKYFLNPISHLEYTYYNRTALQMSMYMYMEVQKGYRPGNLTALVIDRDNPVDREIFYMPYLKAEIQNMINYAFPIK